MPLPAAGGILAKMKLQWMAPLVLFAAGCAVSGRKFDDASHVMIQPGVATRADVDALLGKPELVQQDAGRTLYRYSFEKVRPYGAGYGSATLEQKGLDVLFDESGKVWKKLYSEGRLTIKETGFGKVDSLKPITPEIVSSIKLGETTAEALRTQLGAPYWEYLTFDGWIVRDWREIYRDGAFKQDRLRVLTVLFNDLEKVADFGFEEIAQ